MKKFNIKLSYFFIFFFPVVQALSSESITSNEKQDFLSTDVHKGGSPTISEEDSLEEEVASLNDLIHDNEEEAKKFKLRVDTLMMSEEQKGKARSLVDELMSRDQTIDTLLLNSKKIISLFKDSGILFNPYLYEAKNESGTLVYLLGSFHTFALEDINPFALKLIKNLHSCWLEIAIDDTRYHDLANHYNKLVNKGFTANFNDWFPLLSNESKINVNTLISFHKERSRVDLSIFHPFVFYDFFKEDPTCLLSLIQQFEYEGMDFSLWNLFNHEGRQALFLENILSRIEDEGQIERLEAGISNVSLETAAQKIDGISLFNQTKEYATEYIRWSCLLSLSYYFGIYDEDEEDDDNGEEINRHKRWGSVLDEGFLRGQFDNPNGICTGLYHLRAKTGLFDYFTRKGFDIFQMDKDGNFTISVVSAPKVGDNSIHSG